ncbi:MAG: hypothetical protein KME16_15635 [Scytolyngbya sp. HA4215-MV1]|jgi:hypothetical protein|nr:hypothetical protein [Scytolyngbya sp. HA4215-MV1]
MVYKSFWAIALCFLPLPALAATLPTPRQNGDYSARTGHKYWVVVDPDPKGVNCRWSTAMPAAWYDPGAKLPPFQFDQWAVVKQFKKNTMLTANLAPAGFAMLSDTQGRAWLKVSIGVNDRICMVRANAKLIKPIQR